MRDPLSLVVAMGTAEAAAAAASTDGDPGSAHDTWRQRRCGWQRSWGPSPPVPYTVIPSFHLSHTA